MYSDMGIEAYLPSHRDASDESIRVEHQGYREGGQLELDHHLRDPAILVPVDGGLRNLDRPADRQSYGCPGHEKLVRRQLVDDRRRPEFGQSFLIRFAHQLDDQGCPLSNRRLVDGWGALRTDDGGRPQERDGQQGECSHCGKVFTPRHPCMRRSDHSCCDILEHEWCGGVMKPETFLPLSAREFHILVALAEEPRNGYQVSVRVEENSAGRVSLSPATQFTVLHRLVAKGLVREATDEVDGVDGRGQRFWTLTPLGRGVLDAEALRLQSDARLALALGGDE